MSNQSTSKPGALEMLPLIKSGTIVPIEGEYGDLIGFHRVGKSTQMSHLKMVQGHLTSGATEEERLEDEKALKNFMEEWKNSDIMGSLQVALMLNKPNLTPEEVSYIKTYLGYELGRTIIKEKVITTPTTKKGKYGAILDGLASLDTQSLKDIMVKARRAKRHNPEDSGSRDLYNATRSLLRARGIEC